MKKKKYYTPIFDIAKITLANDVLSVSDPEQADPGGGVIIENPSEGNASGDW